MIQENTALAMELFAIMAIMLYGAVLSYALHPKRHFMVNVVCAAVVVLFGMIAGLSLSDTGLAPQQILQGIAPTLAFAAALILLIFIASYIPGVRKYFKAEPVATKSKKEIAHTVAFRIPLSTALLEETLFRGVMLGLLIDTHGEVGALIISSIMFGLWHIFPTVAQLEQNGELANSTQSKKRRGIAILGVVFATTLAGLFFGALRLWTGSLLTPWLIHWVINASGVIAAAHSNRNHQHKNTGT